MGMPYLMIIASIEDDVVNLVHMLFRDVVK